MSKQQSEIKIFDIKLAACEHFGIPYREINVGGPRQAKIVLARQAAMYAARKLTGKSLPQIGSAFGNADHTTVLHAVRKIHGKMSDPVTGPKISEFLARFQLA